MSSLYRRNKIYWLSFRQSGRSYCQSLKTKDRSTALYLKAQKDKELIEGRIIMPDKKLACLPILDKYKRDREHSLNPQTNNEEYSRIKAFFEWANIASFKQIILERMKNYLNHRLEKDKISLYTANKTIQNTKTFLNWCVKNHYIFYNPLKDLPKYRTPQKEVRFLSKKEIKDLLKVAQDKSLYCDRNPTLYPVIAIGIYTGLRRRELFNLEWQDIDWSHNLIKIKNKEGFTTKNRKNRTIPLHNKLHTVLRPLAKKAGFCFDVINNRRIFGRIKRRANLQDIGWHTLRHTFASQALMAGVPLSTVSKWLGHSSVTTTMIYSHLLEDHEQNEIKKLDF